MEDKGTIAGGVVHLVDPVAAAGRCGPPNTREEIAVNGAHKFSPGFNGFSVVCSDNEGELLAGAAVAEDADMPS